MKREAGNRTFPIWLLGDSEPKRWRNELDTPLDPRHPIRHNIWTSVLDVVQEAVFRADGRRVDAGASYIRNAVGDPAVRPGRHAVSWPPAVVAEVASYRKLVGAYAPSLIICFGAFSFEFGRRVLGEPPARRFGHWTSRNLGTELRHRIAAFDPSMPNLLPFLHRSIAGGWFLSGHQHFCDGHADNYFEHVGAMTADVLLSARDELDIWL